MDDVPEQREIACALLKKLKYSAATVESGEKAVDYVKNNPVDLIILDMIIL